MDKTLVLVIVLVIVCLIEWWIYNRYLQTHTLTPDQKRNAQTCFGVILVATIVVFVFGLSYSNGIFGEEYGFFGKKYKVVQAVPEARAYGGNPMKGQDYSHKGPKVEPKTDTSKIYRKFTK
jgi:cytochrome b561